MKNEELVKQLTSPSKNSRLDCFHRGDDFTFRCSKRAGDFLCQ